MKDDRSSSRPSRWSAYREVDDAGDPSSLGDDLDEIASVPGMAAEKHRSLALLGLAAGASVLDVGCGNGTDLQMLAEIVGSSGRIVGVDRSSTLIDDARTRLSRSSPIELVVGDVESLAFGDATFDAARADRTLQHLPQPDLGIAEMTRVIRSGGRVVASESWCEVDAPQLDRDVTKAVLAMAATGQEQRQWVGYLLPVLFELAGLSNVRAESNMYPIRDVAELDRLINLEWCLKQAIAAGLLSPDQAQAWRRELDKLMSDGAAGVMLTIVHVIGVKR